MNHPIQPLELDEHGVLRFKENKIVRHLLDFATQRGNGLNELHCANFSNEDRQQFAQLIGYSLSGYGDLGSYVDDVAYNTAAMMAETPSLTEKDARIAALELEINEIRSAIDALRSPMAELFGKHPDDFTN